MKPASGGLISLLNSLNTFLMADLFTITTRTATYRWTNADGDLIVGANTFTAPTDQGGQPLIERGAIESVVGLETDTMDLTLWQGDTAQLLGIPLAQAAQNGVFDGARIKVERLVMSTWGDTSLGALLLFEGVVGGVDIYSTRIDLKVKADLDRLNIPMPRTLIMPGCSNTFGDANCGKSLPALTVTVTATGTPTTTSVPSARGEASGYFNLGVIQMTSGPAAGSRRSIAAFSGGTFTPSVPFTVAPNAGDTFTAYPGCDRSFATCGSKYSNQSAYRGAPFVPPPETVR